MAEDLVNWILAIADDLTGALEVGAKFAGAVVTTDRVISKAPEVPVLVIDTETRHLLPEVAAAVVRETVLSAQRYDPWLVYKKTDSTLRGNIAAEFRAVLDAAPAMALVYAPAYPAMGRTVRSGHLFVHGTPVHQTAFGVDPLNPVMGSDIRALLDGIDVTVLDGESDEDIAAAAQEVVGRDPRPVAAGPAALAGALARVLRQENGAGCELPRLARCLVVNGSLHPVSGAQMDWARACGALDDAWVACERDPEAVRRRLEESQFDAIVVFGGDTAYEIHRALSAPDFHPCGEVVAGVPLSRCGDLFWITKAGGFGATELLCDIRKRLT